tara:strand:+ start:123 stop:896 length:774 start_codon:yes stop_codon:yes gene_type:complete
MSYYSVILGFNATKTARSPNVWNQEYKDKEMNASMKAIDVNDDDDFKTKFNELFYDPDCLGGAIAVPYKSLAAELCITSNNSINCFFKREKEKFIGINTDGRAAYDCIKDIRKNFEYKNIYVLGNGSTAQALFESIENDKKNYINFVRTKKSEIDSFNIYQKDLNTIYNENFSEKTLIVNCTSVGGPMDPEGEILNFEKFTHNFDSNNLYIFDVNQPDNLNKLGSLCNKLQIKYENGIKMNKLQAKIAFSEVNKILL